MLFSITEEVKRDSYVEMLVTKLKIKRQHLVNALKGKDSHKEDTEQRNETIHKLPDWCDKERVYNYALDWREDAGVHTGFYFSTLNGLLTQMTNFVIKPL